MKNGKYTGEQLNNSTFKCAWIKDNLLHREDGHASETTNGNKFWYINGQLHRLDGPAIEYVDGSWWYYHGERIDCQSQEEFERWLRKEKLKAFL